MTTFSLFFVVLVLFLFGEMTQNVVTWTELLPLALGYVYGRGGSFSWPRSGPSSDWALGPTQTLTWTFWFYTPHNQYFICIFLAKHSITIQAKQLQFIFKKKKKGKTKSSTSMRWVSVEVSKGDANMPKQIGCFGFSTRSGNPNINTKTTIRVCPFLFQEFHANLYFPELFY